MKQQLKNISPAVAFVVMTTIVSMVALSILAVNVSAAEGDGGYAGSYFQMSIGARPTAMGGAYLAVSDDGVGPLYNPAGLAGREQKLFNSSYRALKLDRTLAFASISIPTRGHGTVGFNWLYAGSGSVEARDSKGEPLGRELSFENHAFGILFAKRFSQKLAFGGNFKYLVATFPEMSSFTVDIDLGAMLYVNELFGRENRDRLPIEDLQIGLVLSHFGGSLRYNNGDYLAAYRSGTLGNDQEDKVPFELGLGLSGRFFQRKLLTAVDFIKNAEQGAELHAGMEYFVSTQFALRTGYDDGLFTVGTGYMFNFSNRALAIDYAFSTNKAELGSEHVFSFDILF